MKNKKIIFGFVLISIILISLVGAKLIDFSSEDVLIKYNPTTESISDYTIGWVESGSGSLDCYIKSNRGNIKHCVDNKIIEVIFLTIQNQQIRIEKLEQMLNITYVEPEENSLPLYYCAIERSTKECPGGISGGFNTRCYLDQPKQSPWDYCLDGWDLT